MRELIQVELYKMHKRKCFLIVLIFNGISLLYGLGILLNWSWVSFNGTFDLIQYIGAIWQLLFLIGLPLSFLCISVPVYLAVKNQMGRYCWKLPGWLTVRDWLWQKLLHR
ncbi:hypothetical protein [Blautia producta]|uniref:hypothetical protein n=1 Tax=Blautia producta TaxID=33035 RepID=UPI0035677A27